MTALGTFLLVRSALQVAWHLLNALLPGWPVLLLAAGELLASLLQAMW